MSMINSLKSTGAKIPSSKLTGAIAPVATVLTIALPMKKQEEWYGCNHHVKICLLKLVISPWMIR